VSEWRNHFAEIVVIAGPVTIVGGYLLAGWWLAGFNAVLVAALAPLMYRRKLARVQTALDEQPAAQKARDVERMG
jgi:hypothetical protein